MTVEHTAVRTDGGPPAGAQRLRGNLGIPAIVFMVLAAAAPLGVIGGPVPLGIATGNGSGFPATFVIATVVLLLFAVGFTAMTPFVREAGAFFSYVQQGFGSSPAIGAAFVAVLTYASMEAAVYGLLGPQLGGLLALVGVPQLPWPVWALAGLAVITYLGYRNIELSSRVLAVLLVAEIAIVVVLDAVIVARGGDHGLSTGLLDPSQITSGAPGIGLLFAIISFLGFEATAIFRDEARDPDRTIPYATYLALAVIGVFYTVSSWALISAWGDHEATQRATNSGGTMLVDTAQRYLGVVGADVIQVLFVTSLFACILSFHNVVSRYLFALSGRGVLPAAFGRPHARHGSPHAASLALSALILAIIGVAIVAKLDPSTEFYTWLSGITTVGVLALMVLTSAAVLTFFARDRRHYSVLRVRVAPALGLAGLVAFLVLILVNLKDLVGGSSGLALAVILVLVVGFVGGAVLGYRHARSESATPAGEEG
ncbi:amino acid transporter [Mycolicibacterium mucogenicum]|uniref:Amino acid transporter n=1 Tax=Mycolicibacterium mucogenicum TaxID=56689 RepID=A0A1A3GRL1_MYCMU|nr:APC family permease [Mycolicibacterium mucogenicum]OBJ38677.1 amino acid transporter [Mycolicibacterium mucogenicum]